jgi:hypothetical protein
MQKSPWLKSNLKYLDKGHIDTRSDVKSLDVGHSLNKVLSNAMVHESTKWWTNYDTFSTNFWNLMEL